MTESKIDATHRLQKSGQWYEASIFRDAERKRFREQGMTRAEAGDAAWESMIQEYPSPEDEMEQLLEVANNPPHDTRNLSLFRLWFAVHTLRALAPFAVDGEIPDDILQRAWDAGDPGFRGSLYTASENPRYYINFAKEVFQREIVERRRPPTEHDEAVAVTMEENLKWLPELEVLVSPSQDCLTETDEATAPVEAAI